MKKRINLKHFYRSWCCTNIRDCLFIFLSHWIKWFFLMHNWIEWFCPNVGQIYFRIKFLIKLSNHSSARKKARRKRTPSWPLSLHVVTADNVKSKLYLFHSTTVWVHSLVTIWEDYINRLIETFHCTLSKQKGLNQVLECRVKNNFCKR